MLSGLDYHYDNFMSKFKLLKSYYQRQEKRMDLLKKGMRNNSPNSLATASELQVLECLEHEAFAYINKLGQFYYFAKAFGLESQLSRASELMRFRHKHTAHRSIDSPRKDDDANVQEWHAQAFGFGRISIDYFLVFQITDHQGSVQFHMRNDHPIIMQQTFEVLQAIFPVNEKA